MPKTTAKVCHRDYVPWNWIAIEFCDVDFYGFRAKEMEEKWADIKYNRYITYNPIYKANETKLQNLHNQVKAIHKQVEKSKPFYRFWYNKAEKKMLSEADKLLTQANELQEDNKKVGEKRWFGVYECHRKIEDLLQQHGFVLTSTSYKGDECVTETEVWTLEE